MELRLIDIEKSFGEKQVLRGISLVAESGKALGLLGRNGAGKTTTIRILLDVFPADRGEVRIDGKPIDRSRIGIGYLPEERGLYPKKKILDQLLYFAELKGMKGADALKAVDYWLERLDMTEYRKKRLDTLSKGNQQKIQLITALVHDPDILMLDEPFSGLDPVNAMLLKDVVKEEMEKGKIVLFSSHQMNYIEEFCDQIAILHEGRIAVRGSIHDIKRERARDTLIVRSEQAERIAREWGTVCQVAEDRTLLIKLNSPDEKQSVMRRLSDQYDIDEIRVSEPSLNEIFVEYTGGPGAEDERK